MMIQSGVGGGGGVTTNKTAATRLASFSASQIFGGCHERDILIKKTNSSVPFAHRKMSHSNITDGGRRRSSSSSSPHVFCPKAVSDSSYSQTCLDPDASNVCTLHLSLPTHIIRNFCYSNLHFIPFKV